MTIDINELREAIQTFGSQAINEGDLNELLDRLELTESREAVYKKAFEISENTSRDLTEKVIPNIRNQLEAAERDIALKERVVDSLGSELNAVANERDALQAKVEAMERQKPFSYMYEYSDPMDGSVVWKHMPGYWNGQFPKSSKPLYLDPGAKGE